MFAELVYIDKPLKSIEKPLSFVLENALTDEHKLNIVVEDKRRQFAIFVTQSK
jgi:hypothetical protein